MPDRDEMPLNRPRAVLASDAPLDILGIAREQGDRLDRAYLHRSAEILAVADLLERVLDQVRGQS